MTEFEQSNLLVIRRCLKRRQAEQYALVLTAMGIRSLISPEDNFLNLCVAHADAPRANSELAAYDNENTNNLNVKRKLALDSPRMEVGLAYWAFLLFFFAAARKETFSFDWANKGAAQAGLMLDGEWWRAITALCLHIDAAHLFGNLIFGTAFLMLLIQITGAGVASLSMVIAGAMGNALNAAIHSPAHTSIGASTAIFSGVGLLTVLRHTWRPNRGIISLRRLLPLAGGVMLLVFLGLSGEKTDVSAHILGFGSGVAVGWVLVRLNCDWPAKQVWQWTCAGVTVVIMTTAWVAAAFT